MKSLQLIIFVSPARDSIFRREISTVNINWPAISKTISVFAKFSFLPFHGGRKLLFLGVDDRRDSSK